MFGSAKLPDPREKVGAIYDATRPRVERAIQDPEVQEAVRRAYVSGRHAFGQITKQKDLKKAAQKVAKDKKVQGDLVDVMRALQFAVGEVAKPPKKQRGRGKRFMLLAGAAGVVAFVVPQSRNWLMSKFGGGDDGGWGGNDNGGSSTGGNDAIRPAGAGSMRA